MQVDDPSTSSSKSEKEDRPMTPVQLEASTSPTIKMKSSTPWEIDNSTGIINSFKIIKRIYCVL